ncbi:MAG: 4Fe-4S dicluster domain-containing protein [Acidobacteriia bacterium]|nr:4Fe-4S dicluster domain-containing protein [Terriglobia bacterium]
MKILKIPKQDLDLFVSVLPAFGEVYAPVKRGAGYAFDRAARWSDVQLKYPRTILPPKKFLLPPREATFLFDPRKGYRELSVEAAKPVVLFGVHAYDIFGLNILDRVFAQGRYVDPYYVARRKSTAIIGIDFEPDDKHFAYSMNADFVESGFDLFLSDIGADYLVLVGTSRGDDIVLMSGSLLQKPTQADFAEYKRRSGIRRSAYRTRLELGELPEILEMEYHSKVWEEMGERCLSCGSCSAVCPTCYCFDVNDEAELGDRTGSRIRSWDSCLFKTHALVAGGENFRSSRASRIKFRYYHKQRGFVAEYGRPSCVGCGRCAASCPAKIDIVTVIETIRGERDESRSSVAPTA